jgi:hypothetical protein
VRAYPLALRRLTIKKILVSVVAVLSAVVAVPSAAEAYSSSCPVGGSGITVNRAGDVAKFKRLTPMRGMNCPSAQYVMNKWLRRAFRRSYARRLPTRFWDGYVTWYCGKRSRLRWQCNEYDSGTAFRFTAYIIN